MSLKKYREKRDFKKTPEPKPKKGRHREKKLHFVVQKHAARRLHYDFRLEVEGVLKSWAIPKGPSLNPKDRRLAVMTEDHPYAYKDFEGVIPVGYGAGEVIIWDQGMYYAQDKDVKNGIAQGEISFFLEGEKLKGAFALVRIDEKNNQWLLIKKKDEYAREKDILFSDRSVISNASIEDLEMPHHLIPMSTTLVDKPFDDDEWIFEIKLDGFRAIAELDHHRVDLYSRNLQSFKERFPLIYHDLKKIKKQAIFDGEIVVMDEKGVSQFQLIQNQSEEGHLKYFIFDLLYYNGKDLRETPLLKRKALLKKILQKERLPFVEYLDHIEGKGSDFFKACMDQQLEGIIGKRKNSLYYAGKRTKDWIKVKREKRQEAIICGYTKPKGGRKYIGSLLLGVYQEGKLKFIGHVGGGFSDKDLKELKKKLDPFEVKKIPFASFKERTKEITWVKPHFLCEVTFSEWTHEGFMRQPIFLGLREDKNPKEVVKEKPSPKQKFTHLEKIYWPKEKITKGDLLKFYESIAHIILPYLIDRPQSLKRYPNGIEAAHFFQKNLTSHPKWLTTKKIEHKSKVDNYLVITDVESLLYAVNLGCIELHPFFSRIGSLDAPDFLVLDLDPVEIGFDEVIQVAKVLHEVLEEIGVEGYPKTSGARGMHICIPLGAEYSYEQAKHFAHLVAMLVHKKIPKITSLERSPKKRAKRVYIDYLQNNPMQTIVAPYSVRAKPGAPVSTPLEWSELKRGLNPLEFNMFTIEKRIKKKGDFFKGVLGRGINIGKVLKRNSSNSC